MHLCLVDLAFLQKKQYPSAKIFGHFSQLVEGQADFTRQNVFNGGWQNIKFTCKIAWRNPIIGATPKNSFRLYRLNTLCKGHQILPKYLRR